MSVVEKVKSGIDEEVLDLAMIIDTAVGMYMKLKEKREEGRGGWSDPKIVSNSVLMKELYQHLFEGDMIDVINFAAMLHARKLMYGGLKDD